MNTDTDKNIKNAENVRMDIHTNINKIYTLTEARVQADTTSFTQA